MEGGKGSFVCYFFEDLTYEKLKAAVNENYNYKYAVEKFFLFSQQWNTTST